MFQPKPKTRSRPAAQDVIYTLSSAVESLDEQIASRRGEHHNSQGAEQKAAIMKALMQRNENTADPNRTHHLDGAPQTIHINGGNVKLVIEEFARRFRPFNTPPAPTPLSDADIEAAEAQAAAEEAGEEMQARSLEVDIQNQDHDPYVQQVVMNVIEQDSADHDGFFTPHSAPMMQIEDASNMREIQEQVSGRRLGHRRRPAMYAISVKRQRRLKMKKHKYRKLMRKTRNARRRLGQI